MSEAPHQPPRAVVDADDDGPLLFDAAFLAKLERLQLLARKLFRGQLRGERSTPRRGRGLEFSDHRPYQPGDDLRYVDWNISARLDRLFLKLYTAEEDLTLQLLVDTSASMDFGVPSKLNHARRLAAALAYIGLHNLDRVGLATFGEGIRASLPALNNRHQMRSVLDFLTAQRSGGTTGLLASVRELTSRMRQPCMVVVLSDLLGGEDLTQALDTLRHRGHGVVVIQVLAETEIEPPLDGALRLVDAEDGSHLNVTVDEPLRGLYRERLAAYLDGVETACARAGIEYLRATTAIPFEDVVLRYLRSGGSVA